MKTTATATIRGPISGAIIFPPRIFQTSYDSRGLLRRPERTHLAYDGITKEQLATERKFNPHTYPGDVDNSFSRIMNCTTNGGSPINYPEQFALSFSRRRLLRSKGRFRKSGEIFLQDTTGASFNLLRRRNIGETDWGWIRV